VCVLFFFLFSVAVVYLLINVQKIKQGWWSGSSTRVPAQASMSVTTAKEKRNTEERRKRK
jgi:hypothetical protein